MKIHIGIDVGAVGVKAALLVPKQQEQRFAHHSAPGALPHGLPEEDGGRNPGTPGSHLGALVRRLQVNPQDGRQYW